MKFLPPERLPPTFVMHAAEVLGSTNSGLSGSEIARILRGYAMEYGAEILHGMYPFAAPNKRTALFENLQPFEAAQQHRIIRDLCHHLTGTNPESPEIRLILATQYRKYASDAGDSTASDTIIEETRHWLAGHSDALRANNDAIGKFRSNVFKRNILDDLRLFLELLLKAAFDNDRIIFVAPKLQHAVHPRWDKGGGPVVPRCVAKIETGSGR